MTMPGPDIHPVDAPHRGIASRTVGRGGPMYNVCIYVPGSEAAIAPWGASRPAGRREVGPAMRALPWKLTLTHGVTMDTPRGRKEASPMSPPVAFFGGEGIFERGRIGDNGERGCVVCSATTDALSVGPHFVERIYA
jgi:hypothetical protein